MTHDKSPHNDNELNWEVDEVEYYPQDCPLCGTMVIIVQHCTVLRPDGDYYTSAVREVCPNPKCGFVAYKPG